MKNIIAKMNKLSDRFANVDGYIGSITEYKMVDMMCNKSDYMGDIFHAIWLHQWHLAGEWPSRFNYDQWEKV